MSAAPTRRRLPPPWVWHQGARARWLTLICPASLPRSSCSPLLPLLPLSAGARGRCRHRRAAAGAQGVGQRRPEHTCSQKALLFQGFRGSLPPALPLLVHALNGCPAVRTRLDWTALLPLVAGGAQEEADAGGGQGRRRRAGAGARLRCLSLSPLPQPLSLPLPQPLSLLCRSALLCVRPALELLAPGPAGSCSLQPAAERVAPAGSACAPRFDPGRGSPREREPG